MKKLFLALTFMAMALTISAQSPLKYGYFSFSEALKAMPGYAVSERDMAALRAKYEEEGKRVEDDFNKKYEQFLDGQRDFAPLILQKRQAELQEMMEKNVAFKNESKRLLDQADAESKAALKVRLRAIVARARKRCCKALKDDEVSRTTRADRRVRFRLWRTYYPAWHSSIAAPIRLYLPRR